MDVAPKRARVSRFHDLDRHLRSWPGQYVNDWSDHGQKVQGADQIWIAVIGPDTPRTGEAANAAGIYQRDIAPTVLNAFAPTLISEYQLLAPPPQKTAEQAGAVRPEKKAAAPAPVAPAVYGAPLQIVKNPESDDYGRPKENLTIVGKIIKEDNLRVTVQNLDNSQSRRDRSPWPVTLQAPPVGQRSVGGCRSPRC